jgi:hypothetical protein
MRATRGGVYRLIGGMADYAGAGARSSASIA